MESTKLTKELENALIEMEAAIADHFKTMLANDAMLPILFTVDDINPVAPEEILKNYPGESQIIASMLKLTAEHRSFFLLSESDAKTLLTDISQYNDAVDNLDMLFDNWNVAAANVLGQKLPQAPTFSATEIERRALTRDDFPDDGIWLQYKIGVEGLNQFTISRIVPVEWMELVEAANLNVTTVDDIANLVPTQTEYNKPGTEVESVEFANLSGTQAKSSGKSGSIELLYDLQLDLVVELGRTRKPIQEILDLGRGSIIELEKLAGDPVEIYINDKKLAEGEVVVVDDHFGVRITNLIKREDRIRNLGDD